MPKMELTEQMKQEWEDSLNVDFLSSNPLLVEKLTTFFKKYESADEPTKTSLIIDLTNSLADAMNVKISKVKVVKDSAHLNAGSYNNYDKSLLVNLVSKNDLYVFSSSILTTILHELRHAYQNQYLSNSTSQLGRVVKFYSDNYTQPTDSNKMQEIAYVTNFTEVDAQTFSFKAAKALAQEVINQAQNEGRIMRRILEVKLRDINAQENSFKSNYEKSLQVLEKSDSISSSLKEHLMSSVISFYKTKFDSKKQEALNATLIADSLESFTDSTNSTIVTPSKPEIAEFYIKIMSSLDPKDIVSKLDNKLSLQLQSMNYDLKSVSRLTTKKGNNLVIYDNYFQKLRETIEFGKIFLDKFNIPYDENNNSDIYEKYAENATDYLAKIFGSNSTTEFDKMLAEHIASLELRDPERFNRKILTEKIHKSFNSSKIKEILKSGVDNDSNVILKVFNLENSILNGYATKYIFENKNKSLSKFLTYRGVKFKESNFTDIYEKFISTYPKFFAECMGKNNISKEDEEYLFYFLNIIGNSEEELSSFVKVIEENFSKTKLKNMFEEESKMNIPILYLIKKGLSVSDFHKQNEKTLNNLE